MRTALRQVQQELGPEAVILSTQSAQDRVTVIAALDYDEALMTPETTDAALSGGSMEQPRYTLQRPSGAAQPSVPRGGWELNADFHAPAEEVPRVPVSTELAAEPPLAHDDRDDAIARLERELSYLHRMLAERLPQVALTTAPEHVEPSVLQEIGVDAALVQRIQATTMTASGVAPERELLAELSRQVPVTLPKGSRVRALALVGPTGVGKTTTAAKLAARHLMRHPGAQVRFVCTDTYRIGAREQLQTFARLLGTTVESVDDPDVLRALIQTENPTDLVIVDTPGIGPRDAELASQLPILGDMEGLHVVLCLPASTHPVEMRRVLDRYSAARPDGLVLTKLDEAYQLGAALSVAIERSLPVLWVSDGQQVPQDLHRLDGTALVARALAGREEHKAQEAPAPMPMTAAGGVHAQA